MDHNKVQSIVDRAVSLATEAALNGQPVRRVVVTPALDVTGSLKGDLAVSYERIVRRANGE